MDRKLAAILAADIVGYSAQMERDEAGTFARLTERRKDIFEPEIARHGGRIFKTMGDGILAEFGSVVQAVECAVVLQGALEERNRDVPEDQAIRARIGINLGEVIVDGDDRYGEGVNIAARLEQLAEPGGICVSDKVAREVERKLAFGFVPMGPQRVKNIAEPVVVFRVIRESDQTMWTPNASWSRINRGGAWAIALAALLILAGAAWLLRSAFPVTTTEAVRIASLPEPVQPTVYERRQGLPIVHVMPFVVSPGVPDHENVGQVIAQEIAGYLDTSLDVAEVSLVSSERQTIADYLLTGQVARDGAEYSIQASLFDGATGGTLWTGRRAFGEDLIVAELDSFPARIYSALVGTRGEITRLEEARTWEKPTEALTEYDVHLRGVVKLAEGAADGWAEAETVWRGALAQFPESVLLRLDIAEAMYRRATTEPVDSAARIVSSAWALVGQAEARIDAQPVERREALQWRLRYLRTLLLPVVLGDFEGASEEAQLARMMVPRDPQVNVDLALVMANAGWPRTAVDWATYATEVRQAPPDEYYFALGWSLYLDGQPAGAVDAYAMMTDPVSAEHAAALIATGRRGEGEAMIQALRASRPEALEEKVLLLGTGGRVARTADGTRRLACDLNGFIKPSVEVSEVKKSESRCLRGVERGPRAKTRSPAKPERRPEKEIGTELLNSGSF